MSDRGVLRRYALVVFDADDTLRRTTVPGQPCPHRPGEWELLPNVREVLGGLRWGSPGWPQLALASKQDRVAYGHLTFEDARTLLRELALAATGHAPPDEALQLCPHALEVSCACRKPHPGMLTRIMEFYGASPAETAFVGNAAADREAAARAGVAFIWAQDLFGGWDGAGCG